MLVDLTKFGFEFQEDAYLLLFWWKSTYQEFDTMSVFVDVLVWCAHTGGNLRSEALIGVIQPVVIAKYVFEYWEKPFNFAFLVNYTLQGSNARICNIFL